VQAKGQQSKEGCNANEGLFGFSHVQTLDQEHGKASRKKEAYSAGLAKWEFGDNRENGVWLNRNDDFGEIIDTFRLTRSQRL
jgi:hypothetical protein